MTSFLFVSQIILAILIVGIVLLQKSSSGGLVNYSGSNESVFGAKGANGFLTKTTFLLGALFLANTIALSYAYTKSSQASLMRDRAIDLKNSIIPQAPKLQEKLNTLQLKKEQ